MIDTGLYISFVLVASAVIVTPGPNVLVIIATALTHGRTRGLQVIGGTLAAMTIQMYVAATGTVMLAQTLTDAFVVIKWLGVAYLLYLGIARVRTACFVDETAAADQPRAAGTFARGFVVGITNPKTILFFGAFLPQFVTQALPISPQLFVLSVSFLLLAAFFDSLYMLAANRTRELARTPRFRRWLDGSAGTLLIGSGIGLAIARRS